MAVGIQKSGMPGRRETFTLLQILLQKFFLLRVLQKQKIRGCFKR